MAFLLESDDIERALALLAEIVAKDQRVPKTATPVFQMIFNDRVEDFVEKHRDSFRARGEDIDNYEADALERFSDYYNEVRHYADEDLSGPFEMYKEELKQNDLDYKDCRKIFKEVNKITRDVLLEIFIKNEKTNFREMIENVLWERQFKSRMIMPHLRRKSLALYETFIKIFIENLAVIRQIYLNKEIRVKDSVYTAALQDLFDELTATAKTMLDREIFDAELAGDFPAYIFKDVFAYHRFIKIHTQFVNIVSDVAYLYRKMYLEGYIVAKQTPFIDWYNGWENRKVTEIVNPLKPMAQVTKNSREKLYNSIISDMGRIL